MHAVLVRCRLNRLSHLDRPTGEPIRRYEHDTPGALLHVDVKKLGNIPDGGGWRYVGRGQGDRQPRRATHRQAHRSDYEPEIGTAFVHTVIDDHSRVAYAEIHNDETAATAAAVSDARGRLVRRPRRHRRNGCCPTTARPTSPTLWRDTCAELGVTVKKTRPYRPQTNGKIERFHRTLADAGPSTGSTPPNDTAAPPYPDGCTTTITTDPTPPSAASHPSPG